MSQTINIDSPAHFTTILSSNRITVVDFYADWCGPCKAIAPIYEQLSAQLSRPGTLAFTKVNVDAQKQIAQTYNITAMPTFMVFKSGRESKRIKGADVKALDAAVKQLAQEASSAPSGSTSGLEDPFTTGGSSKNWIGASLPRGYGDVTEAVDQLNLDFLNLDSEFGGARTIFETAKPSSLGAKGKSAEGKKDWIESDTDAQMMLFMPFQSTMKLHTLQITSLPAKGEDGEMTTSRPTSLQLYTNRSHTLGFDEADDEPATQKIELSEDSWDATTGTANVELRFVKFQNISSLVIFVVDGDGEIDKTRIDSIRLIGDTGEKKAMGKLEKFGEEQGE
jgi:thioredoxin